MSDTNGKSGIGIVGALQTVFIVNKLTNAGDIAGWSWWWVLSPLWITLAFAILVGIVVGIGKALSR